MMPLAMRARARPVARGFSVPPPVGGLNARDALADMDPADAITLDNFFPEPNYVSLRRGYASHATDISGAITSLMEWAGPASRKLFAANASAIYDVTSSGIVGAADVSGLTNGRWQHTMQTTSGGNFLVICNGEDSVRNYDGTSWTTPTINNVTSSTLVNVCLHKRRLWFVQADTTKAWYLAADAIAGDATAFDLGPLFSLGGHLKAIASWTRDGGAGPDDFLAFISSLGEVAIYQGTDPASANTWAIVGVYRLGAPIGHRCAVKTGGDLAIITQDGVVSLTRMLALDRSVSARAAITDKISDLFKVSARTYGGNFGWQGIAYPRGNMAIFNIPQTEGSTQIQFVMNTLTGAWCRFTGMNASCWAVFNEELYFGGNSGAVWKADTGFQDNGGGITGDIKAAFNYYKSRGQQKRFQMIRPVIATNGIPGILLDLNVDFEEREPTSAPTTTPVTGALWGTAQWGVSVWNSGDQITRSWVGIAGMGMCAAIRLRVVSNGASCVLNSFDVTAEVGGIV
jgi:hypothetical protein